MSNSKKIALVTGASRQVGIGAAIARELARREMDVFVTYFRPYDHETGLAGDASEPDQLLADIRSMGCRAAGVEIDLSDPDASKLLFDHVEETLGHVTVLINNATYSMADGIEHLTAEGLDRHYAVNVRAMALLCAEFVKRYKRYLADSRNGRIINMSSGQSVGPMPGELAYAATKGAVEAFTVSLSAEVGTFGITANAVDPGITDTGWISAEQMIEWRELSPMGRVGMPADVAKLIGFLASDEAGWITGQVIHSRGGL